MPNESPTPQAAPSASGQRILVVDDNHAVRNFVVTMLEDAGYRVSASDTGEQALAQCGAEGLDLLISDVSMPGMGGPELLLSLRERFPGLPALFITGFSDRDVIQGIPVLAKPFTGTALLAVVRRALGQQSR